jgi:hypothetical protein
MIVTILEEVGHDHALRGMAYSFKDRAVDVDEWWVEQRSRAEKRAPLLAPKDGGHNKFLESIYLYIDIEAPRSFWQEFDTYRVGTTKQSESTMHTLAKRGPLPEDFEDGIHPIMFDAFCRTYELVKNDITQLKENLPEGFLQRRLVVTNYKVLRNILWQRHGHRYKRWQQFEDQLMAQVQKPVYLALLDSKE